MNSLEYCYEKAAPVGSTFYYSVKNLKVPERDVIVAITAFYKELDAIIFSYTDIGVARAQFNFWRDEVIKLTEGKPEHPVSIALQKSAQSFSLPTFRLIELIDGVEENLSFSCFDSFEDVVIALMRTAGVRELLIAEVFHFSEKEVVYQLMLVIELVNFMQNLRRFVSRGLIYFSKDELLRCRVTESAVLAVKTTPEIKNLLRGQAEKVERAYLKAQELLSPASRSGLSSLLIRADIARALCKEIAASDFRVMEEFIDLTPLRKWWISRKFKNRV